MKKQNQFAGTCGVRDVAAGVVMRGKDEPNEEIFDDEEEDLGDILTDEDLEDEDDEADFDLDDEDDDDEDDDFELGDGD